jgi:asparagine synthase (glutamine-hydrolysing)
MTGLTFVTDNPTGDERAQTRRVTESLFMALVDDRCRVDDVDISVSAAAHLPRPIARSFEQGTVALVRRAIADLGIDRIVTGGGGDNLFCSIQSPAPVADSLLAKRGIRASWSTATNIAELAEASVWTVMRRGWQRARNRRPYRRQPDVDFLSERALAQAGEALRHPWLMAPEGALPGKSIHVGHLVPAQGLIEDADPLEPFPWQQLLMSQPLVETCLRIPTWFWYDRGCNRALARRAFEPDLPRETVWRRTKGSPNSFLIQILEANRDLIRSLLSDGVLSSLGLIDVAAILALLDDPRPQRGHAFARVMQLVDAEVWARNWSV